jgi:hypothetical protein
VALAMARELELTGWLVRRANGFRVWGLGPKP